MTGPSSRNVNSVMLRLAAWSLCLALACSARGQSVRDFFDITTGGLPVVVTAPHGGTVAPPGVSERVCEEPGEVCTNDFNTQLLAAALSDEIFALMGDRPITIINSIDRDYIDLNRDNSEDPDGENDSYEDGDARPYYDFYHGAVREAIDVVLRDHGRGVLIDLHGQSRDTDVIYRGTRNGQTVARLISESGEAALVGPNSLFARIAALGYNVDPANVPLSQDPEVTFTGGFTVANYGSSNPDGLDAIQIEYGREYRSTSENPEIWRQTAEDLALAVQGFVNVYYPEVDTPGDFNNDGTVNAADYTAWRDRLGQPIFLQNDVTPGLVTQADYGDWAAAYGDAAPPASQTVPEPCCVAIAATVLLERVGRRRRRVRR